MAQLKTPEYDFSRRSFWSWGWTDRILTPDTAPGLLEAALDRLELPHDRAAWQPAPQLSEIRLPPSRLQPPAGLAHCFTDDQHERAAHCYGRSFADIVRALDGRFDCAPDLIALPADRGELAEILRWCESQDIAVIPFGGGSSVVGGIEARPPMDGYSGAISLDMRRMNRILAIDPASRSAHVQAGIYGPDLEDGLRPHGLTFRHYPQSFEFSTLGGWIATRSGGHYATRYTHVEDFVAGLSLQAPAGALEVRRLPGGGAGPDGNRWLAGSEGCAGVITDAWIRLQYRPDSRAATVVRFDSQQDALDAVRLVAQSGLEPSNLRLISPAEATQGGLGSGDDHCLLLGFEGKDRDLGPPMEEALALCRQHRGREDPVRLTRGRDSQTGGGTGAWRQAFTQAPHGRDYLISCGLIAETFETAITWDGFDALHGAVAGALERAAEDCEALRWTWRFTHVYPDGPAPYYTVLARHRDGTDRLEQWDRIKAAVSDALIEAGGTITHHHAVGRDHLQWHLRERGGLMPQVQRAALRALDPRGIMNPGALWGLNDTSEETQS